MGGRHMFAETMGGPIFRVDDQFTNGGVELVP